MTALARLAEIEGEIRDSVKSGADAAELFSAYTVQLETIARVLPPDRVESLERRALAFVESMLRKARVERAHLCYRLSVLSRTSAYRGERSRPPSSIAVSG